MFLDEKSHPFGMAFSMVFFYSFGFYCASSKYNRGFTAVPSTRISK